MRILVIDGQGGGIGKQMIAGLKESMPEAEIMAVGTNAIATSAMIRAGADQAATGENPVVTACRKADVIVGPIGIVIADALFGEVTPQMALAVGQSPAKRILIPVNHCDNVVVGVGNLNMGHLVQQAVEEIRGLL